VELWKQHDTLRFKERFLAAHEEFCDSQEQILYSLNGGLKPGQNPVGLLGTLNANRPEKWHPALKLTHEVPNELIQQLQRLKALGPSPAPKELGPGAVDAEEPMPMPWEWSHQIDSKFPSHLNLSYGDRYTKGRHRRGNNEQQGLGKV
jgi:hypothetical protein